MTPAQTQILQLYWKALLEALDTATPTHSRSSSSTNSNSNNSNPPSSPSTPTFQSNTLKEELWLACALDRPDQLTLRFLRARKWDVTKAVDMTVKALQWRIGFGVGTLLAHGERMVDLEELECGKSYFQGVDKEGRPCSYVHVQLHDKNTVDRQLTKNLTVLTLETGRLVMRPPQEMANIVFDMTGFGLRNFDNEFLKFLVQCMQDYYPESLGRALVVNAPWVFNGCWAIIKPWLDPVVVAKVSFVKMAELPNHIDVDQLPKKLGGNAPDWAYHPMGKEEEDEYVKSRADTVGAETAWRTFRDVAEDYEKGIKAWAEPGAPTEGKPKPSDLEETENRLHQAYVGLSPFIRYTKKLTPLS
ncbi:hypothetical protein HKX48_003143 [Thoreauomyces humboldtii]|nr:hypothetical protein HKX48_003143 [Thoreauomyces humboldtii]